MILIDYTLSLEPQEIGTCIQCGEEFLKRNKKDIRCIDCRLKVMEREKTETPDVVEFMENAQIDQAWNFYND